MNELTLKTLQPRRCTPPRLPSGIDFSRAIELVGALLLIFRRQGPHGVENELGLELSLAVWVCALEEDSET